MDMQTKSVYKPGDRVIIRDTGYQYSVYNDWFDENKISVDIAARYQYSRDMEDSGVHVGDVVTVVAAGPHDTDADAFVLAVEEPRWNLRVWLIDAEGVEPETKTYNVRISFPKQIRAKSFAEANDIAREYLSNATGIAVDDMEVYEE